MSKLYIPACSFRSLYIIVVILIGLNTTTLAQSITYYVDSATGNDAHAGTSWGTAFRNVTKAVAVANTSTTAEVDIWITKGTYTPIDGITSLPADHKDTSFTLYRGNGVAKALKIYGGFAGTETSTAMRDTANHTYLDATIGSSLYSYHVVVIAGQSPGADSLVLDGLTIRNAVTAGTTAKLYNAAVVLPNSGGGIYFAHDTSATLICRNCTIINNRANAGGGIYSSSADFTLLNCNIVANANTGGWSGGGGMYDSSSSPLVNACNFNSNSVSASDNSYGGAIFNHGSSPVIRNSNFQSNSVYTSGADMGAATYGGAIYNDATSLPVIDSCNFISNLANGCGGGGCDAYGGAIDNQSSSCVISNCTFSHNSCCSVYQPDDLYIGGHAYGGAIYNQACSPVITHSSFTMNAAHGYAQMGSSFSFSTTGNGYGYGGGISNQAASPVISYCTFTADTAYGYYSDMGDYGFGYGGGVYNNASATVLSNCKFSNEAALGNYWVGYYKAYGGAVCSEGGVQLL